jgi:hypothetical protein
MEKYQYKKGERITEIQLDKVWIKEYMLSKNSVFKSMFPDCWEAIFGKTNGQYRGHIIDTNGIKNLLSTGKDFYVMFITTESKPSTDSMLIGQRAILTNGRGFTDITWLVAVTNLCGCKFESIDSPYEDYINEFIEEVYF